MPLTRLQSRLLLTLARQRSPDSDVAGGAAINRDGPRFSADIDIFHDSDERLAAIAASDAASLANAGFAIDWLATRASAKRAALVGDGKEQTRLARRGHWPSSPEIARAMLERYAG